MSILRETIRLRDESARPYTTTPSRYPSAVSVLFTNVHEEQHRQTAYSAGAQSRAEFEGLPAIESLDVGHSAAVTTFQVVVVTVHVVSVVVVAVTIAMATGTAL